MSNIRGNVRSAGGGDSGGGDSGGGDSGTPYSTDADTVALYHFDGNGNDDSGNGFDLTATGNVTYSDADLSWMTSPSGQAACFSGVGDTLSVSIPDADVMPGPESQFTVEWRMKPNTLPPRSSTEINHLNLYQSYDTYFSLRTDSWADPYLPSFRANGTAVSDSSDLASFYSTEWMHFQMTLDASGTVRSYIDGELISEVDASPNVGRSSDWTLTLGNFDGCIDELRISRTVRVPFSGNGGGGSELNAITNFAAASGGTTSIDLTWDDASDEDLYVLERSTDGGTTWAGLTLLAAGTTAYSDTGLSVSTTYHYRIRSIDDQPGSSALAEANATTDAPSPPQTKLVGHWNGDSFDTGDDEWDGVNTASDKFTKDSGTSASVITDWAGTGQKAVSIPANTLYRFTYGVSDYDHIQPDLAAGEGAAIYAVFRTNKATGGRQVWRYEDDSSSSSNCRLYVKHSSNYAALVSQSTSGNAQVDFSTVTVGAVTIVGLLRGADQAGNDVIGQVNNVPTTIGVNAPGSDVNDADTFEIGHVDDIEIAEILHYDESSGGDIDNDHHDAVMLYLKTKYGIA